MNRTVDVPGDASRDIPWDLGVALGDVLSYIDFETLATVDRKAEVRDSLHLLFDAAMESRQRGVA